MISRLRALLCTALSAAFAPLMWAQISVPAANYTIQTEGLRSSGGHGSFKGAIRLPDDTLVLLYDQGDGLRLIKTDRNAQSDLAEAHQGASGDAGLALTTDPSGNIYVAGTSTSGALAGTSGAAFPASTDHSSNPFIAGFDSDLRLIFLTFLGASRTGITGIAATSDAIFVTGTTFSSAFPVTNGSSHTAAPTNLASGAGYVASFTSNGAALRYATFLDGLNGGTTPAAISADSADNAYIDGSTSDPTFPTVFALEPLTFNPVSGFLAKLSPDGQNLLFSTFLPGSGLTSLALDTSSNSLLLTGNIDPGQFPIEHASTPVAGTLYQSLIRLSTDGQSLLDSVLLAPGTASSVTPGPNGTAWITGTLSVPLGPAWQDRGTGDAFLLHLTADDQIDQVLCLGGHPTANAAYAALATTLAAPVLSTDGSLITVPGTVNAHTAASLRSSQTFDLSLISSSGSLLPNTAQDLLPGTCPDGSDCSGSAGFLTQAKLATAQASLTLSTGDLPILTLRNNSLIPATALQLTTVGVANTTDCQQTLPPYAQCSVLLSGSGLGTITVTAANAPSLTQSISTLGTSAPSLAFDSSELDFGLISSAVSPASRTITLTNLTTTQRTFASAPDAVPSGAHYTLSELASTCGGPANAHVIPAQGTCTVTIGLTASAQSLNDGPVQAYWRFGTRELPITGFTQAASLTISSTRIDFGPQPTTATARLARVLYLSNNALTSSAHTPVSLPVGSPFSVLDGCPASLAPGGVCPLTIGYNPTGAPAFDSATLSLDQGLIVLVTGEVLGTPPGPITAPTLLTATPESVTFTTPVQVTQVSAESQTVRVTNPTSTPTPLSISVLGDFVLQNDCGAILAPGATCSLLLSFVPSQPGTRAGLLTVATGPGAQPTYVPLTGTATAILQNNNGTLDLGTTTVLEPSTTWLQIQGSFSLLSITTDNPDLGVALLADDGIGHGTLAPSAFTASASASCSQCWLAVQYTPKTPGPLSAHLQLASGTGQPYTMAVTGYATPAAGLVLTPGQLVVPAAPIGATSAPLTLTLTNLLPGSSPVTIQQISSTGDFSVSQPLTAAPACTETLQSTASCGIQVSFSPTSAGLHTGTLTVATSAGPVTANLRGVGTTASPSPGATSTSAPSGLALFPSQADFGSQPVGALSQLRQFTLQNNSAEALSPSFAGTRNFQVIQIQACASLASAATCTFSVGFVPEIAGPLNGTVTITTSSASSTTGTQSTLYLRGYGFSTTKLTVSTGADPSQALTFGPVLSGSSAAQSLTLTNSGNTPLHVRRLTTTTPFRSSTDCIRTLAPGDSCSVGMTYAAANQLAANALQVSRTDHGTLLVETDADTSATTVYLTGTALPSPADLAPQATALPVYTLSQSAITFPNTPPGSTSAAQTVTLLNSGTVPVTVLGLLTPAAYTTSTSCGTVLPQATCTISIAFSPQADTPNPSLDALGILTDAATSLDLISLLGPSTTAEFKLDPVALSFTSTAVGSSTELTGVLLNTSGLPLTLSATLPAGDFNFNSATCGTAAQLSFVAGQSCTFTVTFSPTASGTRSGTLTFTGDDPGATQTLPLHGTGLAGTLQANPAQIRFGNVPLTKSGTSSLTLSNSGNAPLAPLAFNISGANASDFFLSNSCPQAGLDPGASCTLQLIFAPATQGPRTATLSITSTDPLRPLLVTLSGTGTQPPGFTLTVNGSSAASATINSGETAKFPLTITAQGGYTGVLALTCTPVTPAPNASCSTANATLQLSGDQSASTARINTLSGINSSLLFPLLLSPAGLLFHRNNGRNKVRRVASRVLLVCVACTLLSVTACGHGPGYTGNPYTPPGTYQYQVTATSTSGTLASSAVTLTITVR